MRVFKPRYSLATLLIVVTAMALLLWGVPEWREYQRRMEFECVARQLTVGIEYDQLRKLSQRSQYAKSRSLSSHVFFDVDKNSVTAVPMFYKRYWYCIYAHTENVGEEEIRHRQREALEAIRSGRGADVPLFPSHTRRWTKIYVYRLRPAPPGYKAQSKYGKRQVLRDSDKRLADLSPRDQYMDDFTEMIAGRVPRDPGIEYELIHADPPVPAK